MLVLSCRGSVILVNMSKKLKTNRKRTNKDSSNKLQQKHRIGSVSYITDVGGGVCVCGLNRFYVYTTTDR